MTIDSITLPRAEPFFIPGGTTGCLLVHGFTGTPNEMRWLGQYLADDGHTVLGVRLTGHGTNPKDMIRSRWWDWLASVEDGWNLLSGCTDKIVIIGLSLGGVLSLVFSSRYPVSGVIALSTPHHLPNDPRLPFVKLLSFFAPYIPKGASDWHDQEAYNQQLFYTQDPTRSISELKDLLAEMRSSLPKISAPVLLINSYDDQAVKAEDSHQDLINTALGSQDKTTLWVENSGHVITCDAERQIVFQACAGFVDRINKTSE